VAANVVLLHNKFAVVPDDDALRPDGAAGVVYTQSEFTAPLLPETFLASALTLYLVLPRTVYPVNVQLLPTPSLEAASDPFLSR
jgi:hypothetical protein